MANWSKYLATGVSLPAGGPVPQRKEIRELNEFELHVYIEGLASFQAASLKNKDDPLSYYKIAGIHGLPYETWPLVPGWADNGVPIRKDLQTSDAFGGFCTHSSVIFLTWHRPYLALFEQTLYKYVVAAADAIDAKAPQREEYVKAAKNFRMPYWDWARPASPDSVFPEVALSNTLPKSKVPYVTKRNPLYAFTWPEGVDDSNITLGKTTTTRRTSSALRDKLKDFFENPGRTTPRSENLTERVGYLLSSYERFASFSHNGFPSIDGKPTTGAGIYGSVEDIHNAIHNDTGGQMSNPAISSFDPIFWLHHTNIDRLFAIWQGLWQSDKVDTWVTPARQASVWPNAISINAVETATTKLYPFRPSTDSWYDSNAVKQVEDFGYTYAEVAGTRIPLADKTALKKTVVEKYPSAAFRFGQSLKGDPQAEAALLPKAKFIKREVKLDNSHQAPTADESVGTGSQSSAPHVLTSQSEQTQHVLAAAPENSHATVNVTPSVSEEVTPAQPSRLLKDLVKDGRYLEWLVNIKAEKHALGGTYSVGVFLGPADELEPDLWTFSPHYVGSFAPFGQGSETNCAKCKDAQRESLNVTGQIPLTIALMERYLVHVLPDMEVSTVSDYLVRNLHWRVRKDGEIIEDRSQVAGLTVFVVTNGVTLPSPQDVHVSPLPVYDEEVVVRPEITTNRDHQGRGNGTGLTAADM